VDSGRAMRTKSSRAPGAAHAVLDVGRVWIDGGMKASTELRPVKPAVGSWAKAWKLISTTATPVREARCDLICALCSFLRTQPRIAWFPRSDATLPEAYTIASQIFNHFQVVSRAPVSPETRTHIGADVDSSLTVFDGRHLKSRIIDCNTPLPCLQSNSRLRSSFWRRFCGHRRL